MKHEQTTEEYDTWCKLYDEIVVNYGKPISQPQRDQWWKDLQDWPIEDVKKAVRKHLKQSQYFPTIADLQQCRPVRYIKAADVDKAAGLDLPISNAIVTLSAAQESVAAKLTDQEVRQALINDGLFRDVYDPEGAIEAIVQWFRDGNGIARLTVAEMHMEQNSDDAYKPF